MTETSRTIVPLILAGGSGTRLWPMSRTARPKQFLALLGENSLFQDTLLRLAPSANYAPPIVITNEEYRFLVAEQAREAGIELGAILLEPIARNTAPAIAAGAIAARERYGECIVHVLPSDHLIGVDKAYRRAIAAAVSGAQAGLLVTFGITPDEPATGFGYIEAGEETGEGVHAVSRFVEKPDRGNAEAMIAKGNYFWNSGMFLFSAQAFLDEAQTLAPEVVSAAQDAVAAAVADLDFLRLDEDAFARAPSISVDYAVFEHTRHAAVVPARIEWSDLGSWDALWKSGPRDDANNLVRGPVTLENVTHSLAISEKLHVVADGLDDLLVLASEDAVYVGRLSAAQGVGNVVKKLRAGAGTSTLTETHQTSYRPWGGYSSILNGERFQVKRLFVKPGMQLSLQRHHHRSEHWVVVKGTAEVTIDETTRTLGENESVYIPQGAVHRLANPGKILLEVIEVQTGSYLGEDDIIRIADAFGRS